MTHYIGMAGIHGCLPQTCEVYDDPTAATDGLAQIHDLTEKETTYLLHDMYIELDMSKHGNEYAEITECSCDTPGIHSDSQ